MLLCIETRRGKAIWYEVLPSRRKTLWPCCQVLWDSKLAWSRKPWQQGSEGQDADHVIGDATRRKVPECRRWWWCRCGAMIVTSLTFSVRIPRSITNNNMATLMRRPFAAVSILARELPQTSKTAFRSFQTSTRQPIQQSVFKQRTAFSSQQQSIFKQTFRQNARGYQTQAPPNPLAQGNLTQRLICK